MLSPRGNDEQSVSVCSDKQTLLVHLHVLTGYSIQASVLLVTTNHYPIRSLEDTPWALTVSAFHRKA